jgi:putative salt-induced outer membrane protein
MVKHILSIFASAVFAGNCFGTLATQTNSPVAVETNLPPKWDGSVALGLTATAGNSDSVLFTGKFQTHKKSPWNEFTLGGDATYGETDSTKNNETLHGFGQYNHLFGDRWYGYANADALHDGIADVKYRFTFSPGVGYYFIKTPQTSLAGEFGPGILYEKLDGGYDTYATLRLAERFEHKFNDHARLWQKVEFLPQVDKPDNFLVNFEIGVETALTQKISLQVYMDDNFANEPAPGRKDNDVKLVSGLAYKF